MESNGLMFIIAALLAVSEALALIPRIRANSIFQTVWNILKFLGTKDTTKEVKNP